MDVCPDRDIHEVPTQINHLSYCFTPKHHGAGRASDAQWLPDLTCPDEFAVFDLADLHQLRNEDANLYGLRIDVVDGSRKLLELGTKHEQIARFWREERADAHWHGFPVWPITGSQPTNRARQGGCPPVRVFDRMVERALLTNTQARRLKIGKHVGNP